MRQENDRSFNVFDKKDERFKGLHRAFDRVCKELHTQGVGTVVQHTDPVTMDEENHLWKAGILGVDTPKQLLRSVFFYNGKNLCLRGGEEHRCLKLSQFTRGCKINENGEEDIQYVYTEHGSKNITGGSAHLKVANKVVPIYSSPDLGNRCHVRMLDLYCSHLPSNCNRESAFYFRPLAKPSTTGKWYANQPLGHNTLMNMLKTMFTEAGMPPKSNHALRAFGASTLFSAGVPEQLVQEQTGHRSVQALRLYQKPSELQKRAVTKALSGERFTTALEEKPKPRMANSPAIPCQVHPQVPTGSTADYSSARLLQFEHCTVNVYVGKQGLE